MNTFLKSEKTEENQKTALFTGEGAYHGSSDKEPQKKPVLSSKAIFPKFNASFANICNVKSVLRIPSQEEIRNDGVVFVWSPFDEAVQEAGPLTKSVLLEMEPLLKRDKKHIYVDSKIQYFHRGDLPVDSQLWHVDGATSIRGEEAYKLGYTLLHDMAAKSETGITDKYLAYQSSYHCATQWVSGMLDLSLPRCIPSFDILDELVRFADPRYISQPAGSIVQFTDNSLHRAVPATEDGWRLWIRCVETDREVHLNSSIINCYGTVFKQG